jgi:hypothetical protein
VFKLRNPSPLCLSSRIIHPGRYQSLSFLSLAESFAPYYTSAPNSNEYLLYGSDHTKLRLFTW